MKKKVILVLSYLFVSIGLVTAQTRPINGSVYYEDGEPVVSATVIVKGTTVGTATDLDGKFTINVPESGNTLIFNLIGLKKVERLAEDGMNVILEEDIALIDEIIVTGYQTIKKSSFTGSASVISTERLENVPGISMQARIAGQAAGVQVGSSTGQPGAMESLRIRGTGSINASNEPLYVIDGVPMNTDNASIFSYSQAGNSILSTINANDIASMTIIKDAAAASLYGSRAANGVVVITTKQGIAGKTKVLLRADWGFTKMMNDWRETLNGDDRRDLLHHGLVNYQKDANAKLPGGESHPNWRDPKTYADGMIDNFAEKPWSGWEDWRKRLLQTGVTQNYEVNVQGGNDKTTFYSSLAYTDLEGITKNSEMERITARLNLTHKITNKFTVNASMMYTNTKQQSSGEGTSYSSSMMAIGAIASPQDYAYNEDGSFNLTNKFRAYGGGRSNPLNSMALNYNKERIHRIYANGTARYDIYDGIYAKQTLSFDHIQMDSRVWWHPQSGDGIAANGNYQKYASNRDNLVSQTHLGYTKTFNLAHNIDAIIGYEVEKFDFDRTYATGNNYNNPDLTEIGNANSNRASSYASGRRMLSYLASVNYDYNKRYYISASFRRDGSSKFARDNRWGNFWSVSGSWRLTSESFMRPISHILTDAKIRASYGTNGNLPTGNFDYLDMYEMGQRYNGINGSAEARLVGEELKWEKNEAFNIGLDLTFLNRFDLTFEFYNRETNDLILDRATSFMTGFKNTTMNLGALNNRGIELTLGSVNIDTKDFFWRTTLNLAHNKNKIKKLDGVNTEMTIESTILRHAIGRPFNTFYMLEYAGVDPETGKESFYVNKPGKEREITTVASDASSVYTKSVDPKLQGGITNNLNYKGIDLGFTFTYALGGHLYDNAEASWIGASGGTMHYNGAVPAYFKMGDIWQNPGDNAKLPRYVYGSTTNRSTKYVKSTDHLRLKNITLGYTIPKSILKKLSIASCRVYASGSNILTWKKSSLNVDPELPVDLTYGAKTYGVVVAQTPPLRSVTFGLEVTF